MPVKQSVVFPMIKPKEMSLEALCRAAAEIGFPAIELWFRQELDMEEVVCMARTHRLVIASMCGHASHTRGLNQLAEHARVEAELRESIEVAARYKIPGVIALSGNRNPGEPDADAIATCAKALKRVAPYAERLGVNVNLELLNSKIDHAGYFCDHTELGVAICKEVASPRVKLLYDIYHMQIMEGDVIRTIREHINWIGHFHTAGNPGRQDMDDTQELNYRAICRAIAATGYDLYVGHEFRPKGDAVQAIRDAFAVCNG